VPARQVFLPVENADEHVSQAGEAEAAGSPLGAVKAAQVEEVESAPPTHNTSRAALGPVEAVLVDVKGVEEVGLTALGVMGAAAEGRIQVEGSLFHCRGTHLGEVLQHALLKQQDIYVHR